MIAIYMQKCWVHMPMWYVYHVRYVCHMAPISVNSADVSAEPKVSHFHVVVGIVVTLVGIVC